jgi:hypothetical protein
LSDLGDIESLQSQFEHASAYSRQFGQDCLQLVSHRCHFFGPRLA